jgi:hypothetical protein
MKRPVTYAGLVAAVAILALACFVSTALTDPPARAKLATDRVAAAPAPAPVLELAPEAKVAAPLRRKLAARVDLDGGFDANTPLVEALGFLSDRHGLTILIDTEAFKAAGIQEIENQPVKLRKMKGVQLSTIIRLLASQAQATFVVRPDYVEITTPQKAATEIWGNVPAPGEGLAPLEAPSKQPVGRPRPRMQLVQAAYDRRPLDEALKELSDTTGISIVLDGRRAGDKAKATVTATLSNVPLDTAVRLLANQAELKLIQLDNVLIVTTPENVKTLREEQEEVNRNGLEPVPEASAPPAA